MPHPTSYNVELVQADAPVHGSPGLGAAQKSKFKLLDLFCGAGGAAMGYHRAGFEVVGVDIERQPHYPFEFHRGDALEYPASHGTEFDVIHASPPCQRYSEATPINARRDHPDLIASTRRALMNSGKPYIIENVDGARYILKASVVLCGSMFGLPIQRHRWFEIWPNILILVPPCNHSHHPIVGSGSAHGRGEASVPQMIEALDVPWMSVRREVRQAIPPAYTEYIGKALMRHLAA